MAFPSSSQALEDQLAEQRAILVALGDGDDEATARDRGSALWTAGEDLFRLGRFEEAAETLEQAASALWPFEDERVTAVYARHRQAMALGSVGRDGDALEVMTQLVADLGLDWSAPDSPDLMAVILAFFMGLLREAGDMAEVEGVADVILGGPEPSSPAQRLTVASALQQKATCELLRGDVDEALTLLDQMLSCVQHEPSTELLEEFDLLRATGMVLRGFALEHCGEATAALDAYQQTLDRYHGVSGTTIRQALADARAGVHRLTER